MAVMADVATGCKQQWEVTMDHEVGGLMGTLGVFLKKLSALTALVFGLVLGLTANKIPKCLHGHSAIFFRNSTQFPVSHTNPADHHSAVPFICSANHVLSLCTCVEWILWKYLDSISSLTTNHTWKSSLSSHILLFVL